MEVFMILSIIFGLVGGLFAGGLLSVRFYHRIKRLQLKQNASHNQIVILKVTAWVGALLSLLVVYMTSFIFGSIGGIIGGEIGESIGLTKIAIPVGAFLGFTVSTTVLLLLGTGLGLSVGAVSNWVVKLSHRP